MSAWLYIAAKAPVEGSAKTRLGAAIGQGPAVALYRAFLRDLAARFAEAPFSVSWYVTPAGAWSEIAPLLGANGRGARVLTQLDGTWTERQRRLFRDAAARGEERVVLIASDSPQLRLEVVEDAFAKLERNDVVLGPVVDGGYYLIGMRGWWDVLEGVAMSTETVRDEIVARARDQGLSVAQVEGTFDVDELEDLAVLERVARERDDLRATRAALQTLGLGPAKEAA